jgi:hypothetical protein
MTLGMERAHPTVIKGRSKGSDGPTRPSEKCWHVVHTNSTWTGHSSGMRYVYRRTPSFFYGVSGHGIDSRHRILQHTPRFSFDEFRQISTQTHQKLTSMGGSTK